MSENILTATVLGYTSCMHSCSSCGKSSPTVGFYYRKGNPRGKCISCLKDEGFAKRAKGRSREEVAKANPCRVKNKSYIEEGALVRRCTRCDTVKVESAFRRGPRDHLRGMCIQCIDVVASETLASKPERVLAARARAREWKLMRGLPQYTRDTHILSKYGLSREAYDSMVSDQNSKCAICGRAAEDCVHRVLVVDHCHDTGRVRGLLCNKCNGGIGLLGDTVDAVEKAVAYLRKSCQK